jgi:hypothetical protein
MASTGTPLEKMLPLDPLVWKLPLRMMVDRPIEGVALSEKGWFPPLTSPSPLVIARRPPAMAADGVVARSGVDESRQVDADGDDISPAASDDLEPGDQRSQAGKEPIVDQDASDDFRLKFTSYPQYSI